MRRSIRAIAGTFLVVIAGCQQKSENANASAAAEPSTKAAVGKVEQAVANAVGAGGPGPVATNGPPADGILEPARAEAEAPSGRAPKLTIGSNGAEPRLLLRSQRASLPRTVKIEVTLQSGMGQGLPPIEVTLGLDAKKALDAKQAEAEKTGTAKSDKSSSVTATVRDARVAMPNVPAEFASQIAGLKGGKITFTMAGDGGGFGFNPQLAAGAKPELKDLLDSVAEALTIATLPVPTEPVGAGAYWMVVAREKSSGFGLVGYHMVKLVRVDDKSTELELDTRRYAVGRLIDPALLPPGSENVTLKEIAAGAKGSIHLATDSLLPTAVEADASLRGAIDSGDGAPKRAVQSGTNYRVTVVR